MIFTALILNFESARFCVSSQVNPRIKLKRNKIKKSSAWDYSAKERSVDGKFSAEFESHEIAIGVPSLGGLWLCAGVELL